MSEPLHGVLAPIVTPFTDDGESVDETKLCALVDRLVEEGVDGLVPCGSTGEFPTLTDEERRRVTEIVISRADGRVQVVPQTGALSTRQAVELTRHAEAAGAAAALVLPPFYVPLADEGYRRYYSAVAEASALPLIAYNIPVGTGKEFDPGLLVSLAQEIPTLEYVKESSGNFIQLVHLARYCSDDIKVLNGIDNLHLPALEAGAPGSIIGSANVVARRQVEVTAAFREGREKDARELFGAAYPLFEFFLFSPHYASGVKAALELTGQSAGPARGPGGPLSPEAQVQLKEILEGLGLAAAAAAA